MDIINSKRKTDTSWLDVNCNTTSSAVELTKIWESSWHKTKTFHAKKVVFYKN